jgi:predicted transcriptional regulator
MPILFQHVLFVSPRDASKDLARTRVNLAKVVGLSTQMIARYEAGQAHPRLAWIRFPSRRRRSVGLRRVIARHPRAKKCDTWLGFQRL